MKYDYSVYFRQNCIVPIVLVMFTGVLLFRMIISIQKDYLEYSVKDFVFSFITGCIVLFLFFINLVPLLRGGIYLLVEKESNQIQVLGRVEKTIEIDSFTGAKYRVENNHGKGQAIIVNGKKYYLTTYGDIRVGDRVVLDVLPRSGFVLRMEKTEFDCQEEKN